MKSINYSELSMRPMQKDSLERMLAEVGMISMYMFMEEQEHIFVERNLL